MSYGVHVFTVDLKAIERRLGCGDEAVLDALLDAMGEALDGDQDEPLRLRELIMGTPPPRGSTCGHVLKAWCDHEGTFLPNDRWCSMRMSWFDAVAGALEAAGLAGGLPGHPLEGGLPFDFPRPDDFPLISHLTRTQAAALLPAIDAALAAPGWPDEEHAAVRQLRGWLEDAVLWDLDLVSFYHLAAAP